MGLNWQPLSGLQERWQANLQALRSRDAALAQAIERVRPAGEYFVSVEQDRIQIGRQSQSGIVAHSNPVPPGSAREIISKLYPAGQCTEPLMIAGIDQGWLWQAAYEVPCDTPRTPGHRPPLYFLTHDPERLWRAMHVHKWSALLADPRIRLFVGPDAAQQCLNSMCAHTHIPWAKLCVTIEPAIWQCQLGGTVAASVDSLWQSAHQSANARMQQLSRQVDTMYTGLEVKSIIRRLRGERLRVMGITSRYTTFLKYSMRDWLDAFDSLGHDTRMIIDQADHEITNPITYCEAIAEFKPDLLLMIDHYRAEITGLPRQIPCVMWVQDNLPNIFNPKAGAAQSPRDYCVGFGRLHLRDRCAYPEQRFLPAQVGVNEKRFAPGAGDAQKFNCDISFVSHASTPATALLTEQINRADEMGRRLLLDVFEQMREIYDKGQSISHASLINQMIDRALMHLRYQIDPPSRTGIFDFFNNRVNNAMFRHQALSWAADLGVNLHIYGRGWENHPRFSRYSKGIAVNDSQLCSIYQSSRINLQITPFGAVHQRLLDGLAAGGFFLIRYAGGDCVEPIYRQIQDWCCENDIRDDHALLAQAPPQIMRLLEQIKQLLGVSPLELGANFVDVLRLAADGQFIRSAASVWPEYWDVSFDSADDLQRRVKFFLKADDQRQQLAASMRSAVIQRFSYTSTSRRLLEFIADDLQRNQVRQELAA